MRARCNVCIWYPVWSLARTSSSSISDSSATSSSKSRSVNTSFAGPPFLDVQSAPSHGSLILEASQGRFYSILGRTNTREEELWKTKNRVVGLVTEDGGSCYRIWKTKDVGTRQMKLMLMKIETCHTDRTLQRQRDCTHQKQQSMITKFDSKYV